MPDFEATDVIPVHDLRPGHVFNTALLLSEWVDTPAADLPQFPDGGNDLATVTTAASCLVTRGGSEHSAVVVEYTCDAGDGYGDFVCAYEQPFHIRPNN